MDQEALAVLKAIKGELVMLRNDFIMLRLAVESIEKEIKKPKEQPQQPVSLDRIFGDGTRIEKL